MKSLKEFLKLTAVIFILLGSFFTWSWWDESSVRGFCDDVTPGTLVSAFAAIAETHHQNIRWLRSSVFDREKGTWITFLPVRSTFGEVACKIEHDQAIVLSSHMQ
jgi:hypothetical protein